MVFFGRANISVEVTVTMSHNQDGEEILTSV